MAESNTEVLSAMQSIWWQYLNERGLWCVYDKENYLLLEEAFEKHTPGIKLREGLPYVVDLQKWLQCDSNGQERRIRRINTHTGEVLPRLCSNLTCKRAPAVDSDYCSEAHAPGGKKHLGIKERRIRYIGCNNTVCTRPCWRTSAFCSKACMPGGSNHQACRPGYDDLKCQNPSCSNFRTESSPYCTKACRPGGAMYTERAESVDETKPEVLFDFPIKESVLLGGVTNILKWHAPSGIKIADIDLYRATKHRFIVNIAKGLIMNPFNELEWTPPVEITFSDDYAIRISDCASDHERVFWSKPFRMIPLLTAISTTPVPLSRSLSTMSLNSSAGATFDQLLQSKAQDLSVIASQSIHNTSILGFGNFAKTWAGEFDGSRVCVKGYETSKDPTRSIKHDKLRALQSELTCMNLCRHLSIVALLGVVLEDDIFGDISLVLELSEHGTLFQFLHGDRPLSIGLEYEPLTWALNITQGMDALDRIGIVHRELRSSTILLTGNPARCKLSCFAWSFVKGTNPRPMQHIASYRWMSPELISSPKDVSTQSSVFSFGTLLTELLGCGIPFRELDEPQVVLALSEGEYMLYLPDVKNEKVQSLLKLCWQRCPDDRPTFASISENLSSLALENEMLLVPQKRQALSASGSTIKDVSSSLIASVISSFGNDGSSLQAVPSIAIDANVKILSLLGRGGFGVVHRVGYEGKEVALKVTQVSYDPDIKETIEVEVEILSSIHHPNIVAFISRYISSSQIGYLCEMAEYGSLHDCLVEPENIFTTETILSFALDVAQGMEHLHGNGILHLDLKPENILLFLNPVSDIPVCKICDFGLSKKSVDAIEVGVLGGTFAYIAPELMRRQAATIKSDVYSYAILIWALVTRCVPFQDLPNEALVGLVAIRHQRPDIPERVPLFWKELMTTCWSPEPELRPSFKDILGKLQRVSAMDVFDEAFIEHQTSSLRMDSSMMAETEEH